MANQIWSFALVILGASGMLLVGRNIALGWAVAIINETLWIVYGILSYQYGFILGGLIYIVVFYRNYRKWSKINGYEESSESDDRDPGGSRGERGGRAIRKGSATRETEGSSDTYQQAGGLWAKEYFSVPYWTYSRGDRKAFR
jgi:hypothetical protein